MASGLPSRFMSSIEARPPSPDWPLPARSSPEWRRAVAVAKIAENGASRLLPRDVLWYHADYVAPSWGRRLARNSKIGLHIFYS